MATDFLGQNLNIGDDVIFLNYNRTSADLERGKITKIFPHAAEIGMKRRAEYKIVKIPADVAPVVHARWIPFHSGVAGDIQYCSNCEIGNAAKTDFCPHCGAKVDGKEVVYADDHD